MFGVTEAIVLQLLSVWTSLDLRRQIVLVAATLAMFFGVLAMSRMATAPSMTLLYSGLESGAAGDVVRSLEQRGVTFEIRGGAIFVDSRERDQLRMTLASEGLPANGSRGYELLDSLSGFGTTSQMFDAAYWRAKEGELARTIVSSPHVAMARVHIASTGSNPFQRGVTPKASVQITPNGGELNAQQAKAIKFLVASAVAGLSPDDVAVINANGSLVGNSDEAPSVGDDDKATAIKERVERLLEARVGFGNAVVEVSVETVTESEEFRERRFDPESRVAISTDTEERTSNSSEAGGGDVTVASNLPDAEGGGGDSATSQNNETRERVNYEVSETERAVVRSPGAIKRLTVAVLVNDLADVDQAGQVTTSPRPEEELVALRELVSSAVGFDEERGDVITIKSMALQSIPASGTEASTSFMDQIEIDVMSAIQMAVLAIVTVILGLFVVRPLLSRPPPQLASTPQLPDLEAGGMIENGPGGDQDSGFEGLPDLSFGGEAGDLPDLPGLPDFSGGGLSDDPVDRLRSMIGERQEETVEVLRSWLEEERESNAT
ncbi:MAG: flagellar basal-body MS-ring/collar protein FliF [Paracoccaceae bacterium]